MDIAVPIKLGRKLVGVLHMESSAKFLGDILVELNQNSWR